MSTASAPSTAAPAMAATQHNTFALEQLSPDFGFYLRTSSVLAERQSPMQHIEIVETPQFGRLGGRSLLAGAMAAQPKSCSNTRAWSKSCWQSLMPT